jgi:tetratricopeptide (TPR) repeat protein
LNMTKESSTFWADIKKYEDILANDPNSYCFTILSELYRKLGLLDDAVITASRGIDIHPDYIGGHMAIGRAYFDKGMREESKNALERVARVTPDNLLAQKLLSQIYIDEGNISEATKTLQVIDLLNPDDMESRQMLESLCNAALGDGNSIGSEGTVSQSNDLVISKDLMSGFINKENSSEAGLSAEQSGAVPVNQVPDSAEEADTLATATLAELYVSQGYFGKAMDVYQELLEKSPENEEYKTRLRELHRHLSGRPDEETSCKEAGGQEENISADTIWEPYDSLNEIPENRSTGENAGMILSILESWLVNIDRRRYATEGNTQKYC